MKRRLARVGVFFLLLGYFAAWIMLPHDPFMGFLAGTFLFCITALCWLVAGAITDSNR